VNRYGITIPFPGVPLAEHRAWIEELVDLGYTDAWSAEVDGTDGFTPLALIATWAPSLQLGVAIAPVFTRGPALLAQTIAAMAETAPGRFAAGIGASSDVIIERWNGLSYDKPYQRVRDTVRFLRTALAGEKVTADYETFSVKGFRLARPVDEQPPLYVAALRSGMLRLGGREADGVVVNWLSAEDVVTAVKEVEAGRGAATGPGPETGRGAAAPGPEVVARIFVVPDPDPGRARGVARRMIASYLNVTAYAELHRWLGRGPLLQPMWDAWSAGDRKGALAAIPDEVVDDLVVHGTPEECRAHVAGYVENGITVPVLMVTTAGGDLRQAVRALAPSA
jgi:probable F420-dependent oxidoreductase